MASDVKHRAQRLVAYSAETNEYVVTEYDTHCLGGQSSLQR
jgi:hypothetical protein